MSVPSRSRKRRQRQQVQTDYLVLWYHWLIPLSCDFRDCTVSITIWVLLTKYLDCVLQLPQDSRLKCSRSRNYRGNFLILVSGPTVFPRDFTAPAPVQNTIKHALQHGKCSYISSKLVTAYLQILYKIKPCRPMSVSQKQHGSYAK